jgi:hypothetical protein
MYGIYSVDITIDEDGAPHLIEINGSNSGFDGFFIAYGNTDILDAITHAFADLVGSRDIFVVTRLVNFGELPLGYLDKLVQERLYSRAVRNVHETLSRGIAGRMWARFRADRPPSSRGAPASLDALSQRSQGFRRVFLNVADPRYVIPSEVFDERPVGGRMFFKETVTGLVEALPIQADDVLWLRCPTLAFAEPVTKGHLINPEFPYDAVVDNKLFTYEVLHDAFPDQVPLSVPIGNRCSGAKATGELLENSISELFIRKPLRSSQARGIEITRREDVRQYCERIARLEDNEQRSGVDLPVELVGVPDLLAAWALSFDVTVLSELRASKPVFCRETGRYHHGCIRSLALIRQNSGEAASVRFLGAYWRLAPIPVDGDGLLWERYVASQSQGAFCVPVSSEDTEIVKGFATHVLQTYLARLASWPTDSNAYRKWEEQYWLQRYREQVPIFRFERIWTNFLNQIEAATKAAFELKREAEEAGFRRVPAAVLSVDELRGASLPQLIAEPHRVVVPK